MPLMATRASRAVRLNNHFDARHMFWQGPAWLALFGRTHWRGALIGVNLGLNLRDTSLNVFERELILFRINALGLGSKQRFLEGFDQGFEPCVLIPLRQDNGFQSIYIIG